MQTLNLPINLFYYTIMSIFLNGIYPRIVLMFFIVFNLVYLKKTNKNISWNCVTQNIFDFKWNLMHTEAYTDSQTKFTKKDYLGLLFML